MNNNKEIRLPSGNKIAVKDLDSRYYDQYSKIQEAPSGVKLLTQFGATGIVGIVVRDK